VRDGRFRGNERRALTSFFRIPSTPAGVIPALLTFSAASASTTSTVTTKHQYHADGAVRTQAFANAPEALDSVLGRPSAAAQATGYAKDFELVGVHEGFMHSGFYDGFDGVNPLNLRSAYNPEGMTRYCFSRNDSMLHSRAILKMLGMQ
jgi:hypothetical protein